MLLPLGFTQCKDFRCSHPYALCCIKIDAMNTIESSVGALCFLESLPQKQDGNALNPGALA